MISGFPWALLRLMGLVLTLVATAGYSQGGSTPVPMRRTENLGIIERLKIADLERLKLLETPSISPASPSIKKESRFWWGSATLNWLSKHPFETNIGLLRDDNLWPSDALEFERRAGDRCLELVKEDWRCFSLVEKAQAYQKAVELSICLRWRVHNKSSKEAIQFVEQLVDESKIKGSDSSYDRYKRYWIKTFLNYAKDVDFERQIIPFGKGRADLALRCGELAKEIKEETLSDDDIFREYLLLWPDRVRNGLATFADMLANAPIEFFLVSSAPNALASEWKIKVSSQPMADLVKLFSKNASDKEFKDFFEAHHAINLEPVQVPSIPPTPLADRAKIGSKKPAAATLSLSSPDEVLKAFKALSAADQEKLIQSLSPPSVVADALLLKRLRGKFDSGADDNQLELMANNAIKVRKSLDLDFASEKAVDNKLSAIRSALAAEPLSESIRGLPAYQEWLKNHPKEKITEDIIRGFFKPATVPDSTPVTLISIVKDEPAYKEWQKAHPQGQLTPEVVKSLLQPPTPANIADRDAILREMAKETPGYLAWIELHPGDKLTPEIVRQLLAPASDAATATVAPPVVSAKPSHWPNMAVGGGLLLAIVLIGLYCRPTRKRIQPPSPTGPPPIPEKVVSANAGPSTKQGPNKPGPTTAKGGKDQKKQPSPTDKPTPPSPKPAAPSVLARFTQWLAKVREPKKPKPPPADEKAQPTVKDLAPAAAPDRFSTLRGLQDENTSLKDQIRDLRRRLAGHSPSEAESAPPQTRPEDSPAFKELRTRFAQEQNATNLLTSTVKDLEVKLAAAQRKSKGDSAHDAAIVTITAENADLKEQVASLQQRLDSVSAASKGLEDLRKKLDVERLANAELEARIKAFDTLPNEAVLRDRLKALEDERAKYKAEIEHSLKAEYSTWSDKFRKSTEAKQAALELKIESLVNDLAHTQEENDGLLAESSHLKAELQNLETAYTRLRDTPNDAEKLRAENAELDADAKNLLRMLRTANEDKDKLEKAVATVSEGQKALLKKVEKLTTENQEFSSNAASLLARVRLAETQLADFKANLPPPRA